MKSLGIVTALGYFMWIFLAFENVSTPDLVDDLQELEGREYNHSKQEEEDEQS